MNQPFLSQFALGNSGLKVSPLGLGAFKLGRNKKVKYPGGDGYAICNQNQVIELIDQINELGVNLIDLAPSYGDAEQKIGVALKKLGLRNQFNLATKVGEIFDGKQSHYDFSKKYITQSVENSLKLLGGERLEIVLLHSPANDLEIIESTDALEVLEKLKREGKIGAIGVSTMTEKGGLLAAELVDILMVSFNLEYQKELSVIQKMASLGKAVLIKKALLSGHISDDLIQDSKKNGKKAPNVRQCLKAVFEIAKPNSVIIGSNKISHLRENAKLVTEIQSSLVNSIV